MLEAILQIDYRPSKGHGCVYQITHLPSMMSYIGKSSSSPVIRFFEHMFGRGSLAIDELRSNGAAVSDFSLSILETKIPIHLLDQAESQYVSLWESSFPAGLNVSFSTARYKKFVQQQQGYRANQWCTKLLYHDMMNEWQAAQLNDLQMRIMLLAKNQTDDVPTISLEEMEIWRTNRRKGYSSMNTFRTKDMSNFFLKREEQYERVRNGNFTDAELNAQQTRSSSMKEVWNQRSPEERQSVLAPATKAAAIKNTKKAQ